MVQEVIRRRSRGQLCGEANPRSKLLDAQRKAVFSRYAAGGETVRGLAREYGVSPALVGRLVKGDAWVPGGEAEERETCTPTLTGPVRVTVEPWEAGTVVSLYFTQSLHQIQ